jgi:hypothetical protein
MYIQDSYMLKTHNNVPKKIHDKLYTKKQQSLEKHQKATRTSTASYPLITITNVLLVLSYQASYLVPLPVRTLALDMPLKSTLINHLNIPGLRNVVVKEYCA